jgi:hypothetical protein
MSITHGLLLLTLLSVPGYAAAISASAQLDAGSTQSITQPGSLSLSANAPIGGYSIMVTVGWGSYDLEGNANCGGTTVCDSTGNASFSDSITILDASGILRANSGINASRFEGLANSQFSFGSFHGSLLFPQYLGDICPCLQPFGAGQAVAFSGMGEAIARDVNPEDPNSGSDTAISQLGFTFSVLNAQGQLISGFHYTSESGHDYGLAGGTFIAPIPEPAGYGVGGLVVLALISGFIGKRINLSEQRSLQ